jgi:hypothetical protein
VHKQLKVYYRMLQSCAVPRYPASTKGLTLSLNAHLTLLFSLQRYILAPPPPPPNKDYIIQIKDNSDDVRKANLQILLNPLISCFFLSDIWVNSRSSLVQGQHPANQMPAEVVVGGGGVGVKNFVCCHREKCKNRQGTFNRMAFWA